MSKLVKILLVLVLVLVLFLAAIVLVPKYLLGIDIFDLSGWNTTENGAVQYLDTRGKPLTGWQEIDGGRYYFLPDTGAMLSITGEHLEITAVKQGWKEQSLIVRVHNYGEDESLGRLTLTYPGCQIKTVYKTDLDENRTGEIANVGNSVVFALRGAGLQTFEITME